MCRRLGKYLKKKKKQALAFVHNKLQVSCMYWHEALKSVNQKQNVPIKLVLQGFF